MKICYLTSNIDHRNGGGRYAKDLISGVVARGHSVTVLVDRNRNDEGAVPLLAGKLGIFRSALWARRYFKECDIIHAIDVYPYGIIAMLGSMFLGKKVVVGALGTYAVAPLHNWKTSWIAKLAYVRANAIVAISTFTRQKLLEVINHAVSVIQPGIWMKDFFQPRKETGDFIVSVGALKYRKGYHISLEAFAFAKQKLSRLKYKIVGGQGDSDYFNQLRNIVRDRGIQDDVEFIEGISDQELSDLYARARLFVLTSVNQGNHFEGFGIVFLEAAASGLPVVGTLGNGIEDAVQAGQNGILVPQGDVAKTAEAICKIAGDQNLWAGMSEAGYRWAASHDNSVNVDRHVELYRSL